MSSGIPSEVDPALLEAQRAELLQPHPDMMHYHQIFSDDSSEYAQETTAKQREKLHTVFDRLAQMQEGELERAVVMSTGRIIDYGLFAKPGDPLPEDVVLVRDARNELEPRIIPGAPLSYSGELLSRHSSAETICNNIGLTSVRDEIVHELKQDIRIITDNLKDWAKTQPEFQVLESFNTPNPTADEDKPLDQYWRQVREAEIEADVRLQFGIDPREHIGADHTALNAYNRRVQQLDHETTPQTDSPEDRNPFKKLDEFFDQQIEAMIVYNQEYERNHPDEYAEEERSWPDKLSWGLGIGQDHNGDSEALIILDDGREYCVRDWLSWDEAKTRRLYNGYPIETEEIYEQALIKRAEMLAAGHKYDYDTYLDIVATCVAMERFDEQLRSIDSIIEYPDNSVWQDAMLRKQPNGRIIDHEDMFQLHARYREEVPSDVRHPQFRFKFPRTTETAYMTSIESMREQYKETFGYITHRPATFPDTHDGLHSRVGVPNYDLSFSANPDFSKFDELDEVRPEQLAVTPLAWQGLMIPGFQVVGRYKGSLVFESIDYDPYVVPEIAIMPDQVQALSEMYAGIGLYDLSLAVKAAQSELNIPYLADLISRHSKYYRPDASSANIPETLGLGSLTEFAALVKGGQLQLQCDSASIFMALSLDQVFGRGFAYPHTGYVLYPDAERVHKMGHAQTKFVHDGRVYIVDAQPFGAPQFGGQLQGAGNRRQGAPAPSTGERVEPKFQARNHLLDLPGIDKIPAVVFADEARTTVREQTIESIEAQLLRITELPTVPMLYKTLARMADHDPMRRTLALSKKVVAGSADIADVHTHIEYLQNVQKAQPATMRRLGLQKYNDRLLQGLQKITETLLTTI